MHTLYIKNMVCPRCIEAVADTLDQFPLKVKEVKLGEVVFDSPVSEDMEADISQALQKRGFELLENKEKQITEQVKAHIIQLVHYSGEMPLVKNSQYLQQKMGINYQNFSKIFSRCEGITIEKYIILQKIEKVKELVFYDELTLSEIACKLGYSSVQHLSNQFKSVTGMSVSEYKKLDNKNRQFIDEVGQQSKPS